MEIPWRELRARTRDVLDLVERGQDVTITVSGRAVANLRPVTRPTWAPRERFLEELRGRQADAALTGVLRDLVRDTTEDL